MQRKPVVLLLLFLMAAFLGAPASAQDVPALEPIPERGPYRVGGSTVVWTDDSRNGREIPAAIWYPAADSDDLRTQYMRAEMSHIPVANVPAERTGAPYPVVLFSHGYITGGVGSPTEFREILDPLVSHGFVVVNLTHAGADSIRSLVDRPLDARFALDGLTALNADPASPLAGLLDMERVGIVSNSEGDATALALAGATTNPALMEAYVTAMAGYYDFFISDWNWATLTDYIEQIAPDSGEAFWLTLQDPRLKAMVLYQPCNLGLWDEPGLNAVRIPTLIVGGTTDYTIECGYDSLAAATGQMAQAGADLLTLLGGTHHVPSGRDMPVEVVQQFMTAYLGYRLQGKADYADYLTEEYASTYPNTVWGIAEEAVGTARLSGVAFTPAGTVMLDEPIAGTIEQVGARLGYLLELPEASRLQMVATSGPASADGALFDPVIYVLDQDGRIVEWNEEIVQSAFDGVWDAGLDDLSLPAGNYHIVIGGFRDHTGAFELLVKSAQ